MLLNEFEKPHQVIPHRVDMFSKNVDEKPTVPQSGEAATEVDESDVDDASVALKTDTRKTRLTLEQINRLRMLNDVKITEYKKELDGIKKQYRVPVAAQ